jgi:chromosome segregation ATPase
LFNSTKIELNTSNSFSETLKLKNNTLSEQVTLLKQQSERLQQQLTGDNQKTSTAYTFGLEQDIISLKESNAQLQISITNYQEQSNSQETQIEELESQVNKLSQVEQALQREPNETRTLSQQITT